jgi:hypothetical protein
MSERQEWKKKPLIPRLRSFEYLALDHICCEAADHIEELETALQEIISTKPEGDTDYKYGYAWECCISIASSALGPEQEAGE